MLKQVQHDIFLCFPLYDTVSKGGGVRIEKFQICLFGNLLSNRLLKNSITAQCVMLNLVLNLFQYWFSISTKSMDYETLNQVQGDQ